jgi:hypothetical protein
MAAKAYASIILDLKSDSNYAAKSDSNSHAIVEQSPSLRKLMNKFLGLFFCKPWWDTMLLPKNSNLSLQEYQNGLKGELSTSLALLSKVLHLEETFPELISLDFYSSLLGAFNLNNVPIEIESPLREYFVRVNSLPRKFKIGAIQKLAPIVKKIENRNLMKKKKEEGEHDSDEERGSSSGT